MKLKGSAHKYGANVDTDAIIPARYLNVSDPAELARHCMEDIDKEFEVQDEVEVVVVRQHTTKTSGYHTNPEAAAFVFNEGFNLAREAASQGSQSTVNK